LSQTQNCLRAHDRAFACKRWFGLLLPLLLQEVYMPDGSKQSLPDVVSKKTIAKANGAENAFVEPRFTENDHFAKTGSGQTEERSRKQMRFLAELLSVLNSKWAPRLSEELTVKAAVLRILEFQMFLPHFMNGVPACLPACAACRSACMPVCMTFYGAAS
jgi:hypothetical protein